MAKAIYRLFLLSLSGVSGFIATFLLAGHGICSFGLTWGLFAIAAAGAFLSGVFGAAFGGAWWVPPVFFSVPLILAFVVGMREGGPERFLSPPVCWVIAFGAAWAFRKESSRTSE